MEIIGVLKLPSNSIILNVQMKRTIFRNHVTILGQRVANNLLTSTEFVLCMLINISDTQIKPMVSVTKMITSWE